MKCIQRLSPLFQFSALRHPFLTMQSLFDSMRDAEHLKLEDAQRTCFSHGIPDDHRRFLWSLLLGYLPESAAKRDEALKAKREQYALFLVETEASMQASARASRVARVNASSPHAPSSSPMSERVSPVASPPQPRPFSIAGFGPDSSAPALSPFRNARPGTSSTGADFAPSGGDSTESNSSTEIEAEADALAIDALDLDSKRESAEDGQEQNQPDFDTFAPQSPPSKARPGSALSHGVASPSSASDRGTPSHAAPYSPPSAPSASPCSLDGGCGGSVYADSVMAEDAEMRAQVDKDLERTFPDLHFFAKPGNTEAMRRVLVTYARLNRGLGYTQGMHELLAPILYVFLSNAERSVAAALLAAAPPGAADDVALWLSDPALTARARAEAEADAFHCLSALMCAPFLGGEFRDLFMSANDDSATGIKGTLARLSAMLRRRDLELWRHLEGSLGLPPYLYGFRWVTTLLVREFPFPDVIGLWDGLLSDPLRMAFLLHTCTAMLRLLRAQLLGCDMPGAMRLLRGEYPDCDMRALRAEALAVRAEELADSLRDERAGGTGRAQQLASNAGATSASSLSLSSLFRVSSFSSQAPTSIAAVASGSGRVSSSGSFSAATVRPSVDAQPASEATGNGTGSLSSSLRRLPSSFSSWFTGSGRLVSSSTAAAAANAPSTPTSSASLGVQVEMKTTRRRATGGSTAHRDEGSPAAASASRSHVTATSAPVHAPSSNVAIGLELSPVDR